MAMDVQWMSQSNGCLKATVQHEKKNNTVDQVYLYHCIIHNKSNYHSSVRTLKQIRRDKHAIRHSV
jgi:hypothetical protein